MPPVLVYVPGLSRELGGTAAELATVIASSQSRQKAGTYSVKLDSVEGSLTSTVSIIAPDGSVGLRLVEADYRPRLAEKPETTRGNGFALLHSGRFALLGLLRLFGARRHSKTGRHRWF